MLEYPLTLQEDADGSILVTCRDLPEVVTFGDTADEAMAMGAKAVSEAIAARLHDFRDIPRPSASEGGAARLDMHLSLVLALFWALREAGITRAELARRIGWSRNQVDRLFDANHESKISQLEAAFGALGRSPHIDLDAAA